MLSGIDQVSSKLADCIKVTESTLQNKEQKAGGEICGGAGETNPRLVRLGPSISRIPQSHSPNPAHTWTPKPVESKFDQDFDRFMSGQTMSSYSWTPWPNQPSMPMLFGNWPSLKKRKSQGPRIIQRLNL